MSVSLEGLSPEAIADLAVTLKTLTDNPKTRAHTLALMKHVDPTLNIPEIDIPNQMNGYLKKGLDRLEALENSIRDKELRSEITSRRNAIVKSGLVNESEVSEVEKLMLEKGISSHETAAEFFASQKKSAAPTPGHFGQPLMPKPDLKAMGGNINQWARSEAGAAMADIIKARRVA
jgi:hypothetical protein